MAHAHAVYLAHGDAAQSVCFSPHTAADCALTAVPHVRVSTLARRRSCQRVSVSCETRLWRGLPGHQQYMALMRSYLPGSVDPDGVSVLVQHRRTRMAALRGRPPDTHAPRYACAVSLHAHAALPAVTLTATHAHVKL
jgi:hypothetical protein